MTRRGRMLDSFCIPHEGLLTDEAPQSVRCRVREGPRLFGSFRENESLSQRRCPLPSLKDRLVEALIGRVRGRCLRKGIVLRKREGGELSAEGRRTRGLCQLTVDSVVKKEDCATSLASFCDRKRGDIDGDNVDPKVFRKYTQLDISSPRFTR